MWIYNNDSRDFTNLGWRDQVHCQIFEPFCLDSSFLRDLVNYDIIPIIVMK
jgi:hypothetical protein